MTICIQLLLFAKGIKKKEIKQSKQPSKRSCPAFVGFFGNLPLDYQSTEYQQQQSLGRNPPATA